MTQHLIKSGTLQHFSFDNMPVRGIVLRMDNLALHVSTMKYGNPHLNSALAEMLSASALLASDLKHNANITLQMHGTDAVPLLVSQCDKEGDVRAYAKVTDTENAASLTYGDMVQSDTLMVVSVEQGTPAHTYQSMVKVNNTSVASSLEQYFNDSVQLNTYFRVMTAERNGELSSGMIFLQALPQEDHREHDWTRLGMILDTVKQEELVGDKITVDTLLTRLFAEDVVRTYEEEAVHFDLSKNRKRMEKALLSIGAATCKNIVAEEGSISMMCEFTGRKESFTEAQLRDIFGTDWSA